MKSLSERMKQHPTASIDPRERRGRLRASSVCVVVAGDAPSELYSGEVLCGVRVQELRLDDPQAGLAGPHFAWPAPRTPRSDVPDVTCDLVDMTRPVPKKKNPPQAADATGGAITIESALAATEQLQSNALPAVFPVSRACCKLRDAVLAKVASVPCAIACVNQRSSAASAGRLVELAMALSASSGAHVLLVDANFRGFALSRLFGKEDTPGLSEALLGKVAWDQAIAPTAIARVNLLPSGLAQVRESLGARISHLEAQCWQQAAKRWKEQFSYILVDAVPQQPQIGPLCRACDATFFALSLDEAPRSAVFDTLAHLQSEQVPLTGCEVYEA